LQGANLSNFGRHQNAFQQCLQLFIRSRV